MIARTWHGQAPTQSADGYVAHLHEAVIPRLKSLPGFRGFYLLRRATEDQTNFAVISLWESMEAIRNFAGADPERAVVEPEARALLCSFDEHVKHHDVAFSQVVEPA
ncbi:MAG: antibiotic biosynthesis monooxygenase [Phycisphaerales bacterium]|nr:antibiotic biosynthesis monooxygenase [Phycisphaerales bacterium]